MIIDEINRANLPKVLGELLFILEYRDTPVRTLYRPDDPFVLPKNVWFIGTMNTADRSIALVDAAQVEPIADAIAEAYAEAGFRPPEFLAAVPSDGAEKIG